MRVRPEGAADWPHIHEVNRAAFGGNAEARLVELLREQADPLISLVAHDHGNVVGHILFTPVSLPGSQGLASLVKAALERCKELGVVAVVVLGHPEFYPKFGFSPAARFGLRCEYDAPAEAFMAIELRAGSLRGASGTVKYHAAFGQL